MNLEQHILSTIYKKKPEKPIRILFPEAENEKVQAVALKLIQNTFVYITEDKKEQTISIKDIIEPVLLFDEKDSIPEALAKQVTIIKTTDQSNLAQKLYQIRKEKGLTLAQAQTLVAGKNYYGMMLLDGNEVDCLVAGINYKTADILRPALQIIKADKKTVASTFIMNKNEETYLFSDCSINILPTAEQLVEIADSTINFALDFDFKTFDSINFEHLNVAMLSYSTNGSGTGQDVDKVRTASQTLAQKNWNGEQKVNIAGEIQFDAAFDETVRKKKFSNLEMKGACNIFIFPDLEAGNIGYKIAQRMGKFKAIGPIILGLKKPVNDLSRGATIDDIYDTALITCAQKFLKSN
ncbi:phosphotransacetylase [Spiroplasma platyhelix]|uniref:Phosphotransacetylase n=1 Tax=Spiroplasma platyhelix PALS-1 TaxID=1276218 RepID=A0A846U1U8_9MOLU|nr:phosphotransacetylase [Spiroplasma platyhelix]MBE4704394.1 Phosphate acetyltransferase [Spiroplasma platyhelix PALS-1]NKE38766.1 phosphotransacetylase [Spiroplasma platyhelix PALS-1]UJB28977.1 phosphotransacetylase [Spiroplasma platyhelix PALS-1]